MTIRRVGAALLGALTVVLTLATVVGWWATDQVFDSEHVGDLAMHAITDPNTVDAVARGIVDDALLLLGDLAEVFDEADRDLVTTELVALLNQPIVAELVHDVVTVAHQGAMAVLFGDDIVPGVRVVGDAVVVNLVPLWTAVVELAVDRGLPDFLIEGDPAAQVMALESALGWELDDEAGQVVLFRSDAVAEASGWADLAVRLITAIRRGLVVISVLAVAALVGTLALAYRRGRAGLIMAVGLLATVLATTVVLGRIAQGSTSLVADPVLSALIHGVTEDAAGHLIATLWWTAGLAVAVAVVVAVAGPVIIRRRQRELVVAA
jgi:hypothetical protein